LDLAQRAMLAIGLIACGLAVGGEIVQATDRREQTIGGHPSLGRGQRHQHLDQNGEQGQPRARTDGETPTPERE